MYLIVSLCIVSYCIVLYCIVLYCIVSYCIVLYCIVLYCIVLYCIVLYRIVLYCIVLHCIVSYCIVLYCIVLYCIVSYRIVLYRIVLYCIVSCAFCILHSTPVLNDHNLWPLHSASSHWSWIDRTVRAPSLHYMITALSSSLLSSPLLSSPLLSSLVRQRYDGSWVHDVMHGQGRYVYRWANLHETYNDSNSACIDRVGVFTWCIFECTWALARNKIISELLVI